MSEYFAQTEFSVFWCTIFLHFVKFNGDYYVVRCLVLSFIEIVQSQHVSHNHCPYLSPYASYQLIEEGLHVFLPLLLVVLDSPPINNPNYFIMSVCHLLIYKLHAPYSLMYSPFFNMGTLRLQLNSPAKITSFL